jgi:hypothetical protein
MLEIALDQSTQDVQGTDVKHGHAVWPHLQHIDITAASTKAKVGRAIGSNVDS